MSERQPNPEYQELEVCYEMMTGVPLRWSMDIVVNELGPIDMQQYHFDLLHDMLPKVAHQVTEIKNARERTT